MKEKKNSLINQAMERLIQEQSFALEMEALSKRMQCLNIEDKVVTLLNELWDKMCVNTTARRPVEITCEDHGMEFSVGELMVPSYSTSLFNKYFRLLTAASAFLHFVVVHKTTQRCRQLGEIFDSMVDEMNTGMKDNDLVRFVLRSRSLEYPISLPFMLRHELNAEWIKGRVQRVLQSNERVNLKDGMQVYLVHVGMLQGGVATRKRKQCGFNLSKYLDSRHCIIPIRNKDSLCLARALVIEIPKD